MSGAVDVASSQTPTLFKRREFEFPDQFHELRIRRRLAVLSVVIDLVFELARDQSCER